MNITEPYTFLDSNTEPSKHRPVFNHLSYTWLCIFLLHLLLSSDRKLETSSEKLLKNFTTDQKGRFLFLETGSSRQSDKKRNSSSHKCGTMNFSTNVQNVIKNCKEIPKKLYFHQELFIDNLFHTAS